MENRKPLDGITGDSKSLPAAKGSSKPQALRILSFFWQLFNRCCVLCGAKTASICKDFVANLYNSLHILMQKHILGTSVKKELNKMS